MEEGRIIVAVGAVITDPEKGVLLVRHVPQREGYWKGKWICPGGKLEVGESIHEGIIREVREETHLEIDIKRALIPFERIVTDGEDRTKLHVIYIDCMAEITDGELTPDDDVGEAEWFAAEELKTRWDELHADTRILMQIAGVAQEK